MQTSILKGMNELVLGRCFDMSIVSVGTTRRPEESTAHRRCLMRFSGRTFKSSGVRGGCGRSRLVISIVGERWHIRDVGDPV